MGRSIKGCRYSDFPGIWDNVKNYQTIIKNLIQISDNSTIYVDEVLSIGYTNLNSLFSP
jgi:hypothetical protein